MKINVEKITKESIEVELEFPLYLKLESSETMFFAIKVFEDLSYIELYKESPENISYTLRQGENFYLHANWLEGQDFAANEEYFYQCLEEFKKKLNDIL